MYNLFVYGTLLFPEIRELVGGRVFDHSRATLKGYKIYCVNGANFPGIVATGIPTNTVTGCVLSGITEQELSRFDQYEDRFYARTTQEVSLTEPRLKVKAEVYEIPVVLKNQILSDQKWTQKWFEKYHYDDFLKSLREI